MNSKTAGIVFGVIVAIVLIIGAVVMFGGKQEEVRTVNTPPEAMMEEKEGTSSEGVPIAEGGTMVPAEKETMAPEEEAQLNAGSYKAYSQDTVIAEQKAGNKVVLFFHAPWCPFCKAADSVFNTRTTDIPAGVAVLKTDYDSNTDLKKKYGVTYQHTFVQIDSQGNMVSKWNGGDIDNLKKYVK